LSLLHGNVIKIDARCFVWGVTGANYVVFAFHIGQL